MYNTENLRPLIDYVKTCIKCPNEIDLRIHKYLQSTELNAAPGYMIEGNFFRHVGYFSTIQNRIRSETAVDYLM